MLLFCGPFSFGCAYMLLTSVIRSATLQRSSFAPLYSGLAETQLVGAI